MSDSVDGINEATLGPRIMLYQSVPQPPFFTREMIPQGDDSPGGRFSREMIPQGDDSPGGRFPRGMIPQGGDSPGK